MTAQSITALPSGNVAVHTKTSEDAARLVSLGGVRPLLSHAELPDEALQATGSVVWIAERPRSMCLALGSLHQGGESRQPLFIPVDMRFPRMIIPLSECPEAFKEDPEVHSSCCSC